MKMNNIWTETTRTCYKHKMICDGCPNAENCKIGDSWHFYGRKNPYNMRNVRYAVLETIKNIGLEDNDTRNE